MNNMPLWLWCYAYKHNMSAQLFPTIGMSSFGWSRRQKPVNDFWLCDSENLRVIHTPDCCCHYTKKDYTCWNKTAFRSCEKCQFFCTFLLCFLIDIVVTHLSMEFKSSQENYVRNLKVFTIKLSNSCPKLGRLILINVNLTFGSLLQVFK